MSSRALSRIVDTHAPCKCFRRIAREGIEELALAGARIEAQAPSPVEQVACVLPADDSFIVEIPDKLTGVEPRWSVVAWPLLKST